MCQKYLRVAVYCFRKLKVSYNTFKSPDAETDAKERSSMGRRLGLIIGVNKYQDAAFRPLKFAETDARVLAQWLVNAQGGKWSPADVQLILGAQATGELVESLITQVCVNVARPDDVVFIYFAGHAFIDEMKDRKSTRLNSSHT